ncbi:MAG: tetratricopeptide repeat protein [Planctomycetia bacterium]|nr:tetratricopeptide repeat protein [Planctomycetia bacterium]
MKRLFVISFVAVAVLSMATGVQSADRIKRFNEKPFDCEVKGMTPDTVKADRSGVSEDIPVGEIESLTYDSEPAQFQTARRNIEDSQNEDARTVLRSLKDNALQRDLLKAEKAYLLALVNAKIAQTGGDVTPIKAAEGLESFLKAYPKYFRVYEITLILGNLNLQMNKYDAALKNFEVLAKAKSSPILQARGLLGAGKVLLAKKDGKNGEKVFTQVKKLVDEGELSAVEAEMTLACQLGLARCYALQGDVDKAIKVAQTVIEKSSPEDTITNASAYNTLGAALMTQPGKAKDAIVAFMHTHLMYNADPMLHQESLDCMITLWRKLGNDLRARELEEVKAQRFGK